MINKSMRIKQGIAQLNAPLKANAEFLIRVDSYSAHVKCDV